MPTPTPAKNRNKSIHPGELETTIRRLNKEYTAIDQIKIVRRPSRSDNRLNRIVLMNIPAKKDARKLGKLWKSKRPVAFTVNIRS
jgi:hypothetical protein